MESQNLLIAALTYMIRLQTTRCETAKARALMMFDVLSDSKECSSELQKLCNEANTLLIS